MKKLLAGLCVFVCAMCLFATTTKEYYAKAKSYEAEKKWAWALNAYFDALATDESVDAKLSAYQDYLKLKTAIETGNPGFGNFNAFTIHDEWKNTIVEAENYAKTYCFYNIRFGDLIQDSLNYETRTAKYTANISYERNERYDFVLGTLAKGFRSAYKSDWNDMAEDWPKYANSDACVYNSSSYYSYKYNAFTEPKCYEVSYVLVDDSGKEWSTKKTATLGETIALEGITPELMTLIDNKQAYLKPLEVTLNYGMKNQRETTKIDANNVTFVWVKNNKDAKDENYRKSKSSLYIKTFDSQFVNIPGKNFAMLKTEVTQKLYETVMGENPSYYEGEDNPVEKVSWYDAIYFCNKLSSQKGLTPVYSVDGVTDVAKWNYTPHNGNSIRGTIKQNSNATGYRLPTKEEWQYAAKGGQNYTYAGSNDIDEVAWYSGNSGYRTQSVAQKAPNGYGIYDMSGNVWEWVWDADEYYSSGCYNCGGSYDYACEVSYSDWDYASSPDYNRGFRVVRPSLTK